MASKVISLDDVEEETFRVDFIQVNFALMVDNEGLEERNELI